MLPVWKYLWGVARDGEAGGEQRNGGKRLRQAELSADISPDLPDRVLSQLTATACL